MGVLTALLRPRLVLQLRNGMDQCQERRRSVGVAEFLGARMVLSEVTVDVRTRNQFRFGTTIKSQIILILQLSFYRRKIPELAP